LQFIVTTLSAVQILGNYRYVKLTKTVQVSWYVVVKTNVLSLECVELSAG